MIGYQIQGRFLEETALPCDDPPIPSSVMNKLDDAIYSGLLSTEPSALEHLLEVTFSSQLPCQHLYAKRALEV